MAAKRKIPAKSSALARGSDGSVQITMTIPWGDIETEQIRAAKEEAEKVDIPGFRKGKAPIEKVIEKVGKEKITEHAVNHLLPDIYAMAIEEHKVRPAIFPKFQLAKAKEGEDWEIRAITAELPEFELGDYKGEIRGELAAKNIYTGKEDGKKEMSPEEREQVVIKALLSKYQFDVPAMLIEEEVNNRLANLLERVEKLGLTLEGYLGSIKKTAEQLREEYSTQARDNIRLELVLSRIAVEEKIEVGDEEILEFIKMAETDTNLVGKLNTPEQKNIISSIIRKRKTIENLGAVT